MSVKCARIEADNETDKLLLDTFTYALRPGYVEVGEEKICMPVMYEQHADRIEHFEVRDSDVIVATHPKTGTTWLQEMIWMILNDMDKEEGKRSLRERSPFLEMECLFDFRKLIAMDPTKAHRPCMVDSINYCANCEQSSGRFMKTHLPWSLLPQQIRTGSRTPKVTHPGLVGKIRCQLKEKEYCEIPSFTVATFVLVYVGQIVCVIRNPKDTCVSYYHHCTLLENYQGDLKAFQRLFLAGRLNYGPFWKHILGYYRRRHQPNILLVRYEEMKEDLISVIKRVAAFLGKELTDATVTELADYLSFENMRKRIPTNSVNSLATSQLGDTPVEFFRSGIVGSYKAEMTTDMIKAFDKWTVENFHGVGLTFHV